VTGEFAAERVALQVLEHLERHRHAIAEDSARIEREVDEAMKPVRVAYREAELPAPYLEGLEREVKTIVPVEWQAVAAPFNALEKRGFGTWRGGDLVARIVYVFIGLAVGGLCVELPFIPIWEKWFPFALAVSAFWLPTAQVAFQQRRYARALGGIAVKVGQAQLALEGRVRTEDLLLPEKGDIRE
jgi:hypothetical protein